MASPGNDSLLAMASSLDMGHGAFIQKRMQDQVREALLIVKRAHRPVTFGFISNELSSGPAFRVLPGILNSLCESGAELRRKRHKGKVYYEWITSKKQEVRS
jgi:hypothetical protein